MAIKKNALYTVYVFDKLIQYDDDTTTADFVNPTYFGIFAKAKYDEIIKYGFINLIYDNIFDGYAYINKCYFKAVGCNIPVVFEYLGYSDETSLSFIFPKCECVYFEKTDEKVFIKLKVLDINTKHLQSVIPCLFHPRINNIDE